MHEKEESWKEVALNTRGQSECGKLVLRAFIHPQSMNLVLAPNLRDENWKMIVHATMTSSVSFGVIGPAEENLVIGGKGLNELCVPATAACSCRKLFYPTSWARATAIVSVAKYRKFRGGRSDWVRGGSGGIEQQLGRRGRQAESSGLQQHILQLDVGSSKISLMQSARCSRVGVTPPLEESKLEDAENRREEHSITSVSGENFFDKPVHLSTVPEEVMSQVGGRAGAISFYPNRSDSSWEEPVPPPAGRSNVLSLIWPLGPFILVASVVLPPLYLRKIFGAVLEDSLVTDFVILFFTETLFFVGASVFFYIAHISRTRTGAASFTLEQRPASSVYSLGYRLSAKIVLSVAVLLPVTTFVMVWPWTGPAAAAALAPYMIGLLVQLGFEHIIHANDSPVWALVPVTFQMYRLHQLSRAAQLVAGLLFSLKGVEATAETMAINGSLQTLLFVLQVLGMLCLWTLGSFLTNQLPSKRGQKSIPSLP